MAASLLSTPSLHTTPSASSLRLSTPEPATADRSAAVEASSSVSGPAGASSSSGHPLVRSASAGQHQRSALLGRMKAGGNSRISLSEVVTALGSGIASADEPGQSAREAIATIVGDGFWNQDTPASVLDNAIEAMHGEIHSMMSSPQEVVHGDMAAVGTPAGEPLQLTGAQHAIAEGFTRKYGESLRRDPETALSTGLDRAFKEAAIAFNHEGCADFAAADKLLQDVLRRDTLVRSICGGALMVGTGYSTGMWSMMRGVMPQLPEDMSPALKGFLGGLMVSSIDKIVSSGFTAVAMRNLSSGGPLKDNIPELASRRPSLNKIACTSAAVAGLGTFVKNLSLRGAVTQSLAPDTHAMALGDLAADTGGAFLSGGLGRQLSHKLLNRHEAASFLAQRNVADKLHAYNTPSTSESIGRAIRMNAETFVKSAGKSTTMPSSYIAGAYCALLMAALMSTHDYITKTSGKEGEFEGRLATFEHTLASAGLMGALVSGAVAISILGLMDQYRNRALARLEQTFRNASAGTPSVAPAGNGSGTARVEEIETNPSPRLVPLTPLAPATVNP